MSKMGVNEKGYNVKGVKLLNLNKMSDLGYNEMVRNMEDTYKYAINYKFSGQSFKGKDYAQGSNFFIKSGECDNERSDEACKNKQKFTYVRNIPIGKVPPFGLSFKGITGCNLTGLTEMRGVLPGMMEDMYDINPVEIGSGMLRTGNLGSRNCKKMKLPVGYKIYDPTKLNKTWKFEEKCTAGHNNMLTTSDPILNKSVKNQNPNIEHAALPSARQFVNSKTQENFFVQKSSQLFHKSSFTIFIIFIIFMILISIIYYLN
jgi:hypothetical protein